MQPEDRRGEEKQGVREEEEADDVKAATIALCASLFTLFTCLCLSASWLPLAVWRGSLWGSVWSRRKPRSGKDCHSNAGTQKKPLITLTTDSTDKHEERRKWSAGFSSRNTNKTTAGVPEWTYRSHYCGLPVKHWNKTEKVVMKEYKYTMCTWEED